MMTQILKKAVAGIAASMMLAGVAKADEFPFEFEVGADIFSHYVWRGFIVTDDPVLQPSVTLSAYGFSFNVWGSIDLTDLNEDPGEDYRLQEIDYTLSYGFSPMEGLDLEAGVIHYTFPGVRDEDGNNVDPTSEVYGSVALSMVPYVVPSITAYYDFDAVDGWYLSASLDSEFSLTEKLTLGLGAALGYGDRDYNTGYWEVESSGLNDLNLSASLSYQVNDSFSVGVSAGYMVLVGSDVKDAVDDAGDDTSQFYVGISAAFAF